MEIRDMLSKIIKDNHSSYARLAQGIGKKSTGSLANSAKNGSMSLTVLKQICEFYDYDIVLRPRANADRAERTIVL